MPGQHFEGQHGVSISLMYDDVAEARRVFAALAEGGRVTMPIEKTFWVELFGSAIDRFGTSWMVNGGKAAPAIAHPG